MVLIEDLSEELPQDVEIAHVLAQALTLKDQGNAAFKAKEWEQAAELYTRGLSVLEERSPSSTSTDSESNIGSNVARSVILSNRAAVWLQQKHWAAAAQDAAAAISANPSNPKAHLRYATARNRSGDRAGAVDTLRTALAPGMSWASPNDAALLQAELEKLQTEPSGSSSSSTATKAKASKAKGASSNPSTSKRTGGFLNNRKASAGLFGDSARDGAAPAPPASEADRLLQRLKGALQLPGQGGGGGAQSGGLALDGVFSKLQDRTYFERTVFPGLDAEQRAQCPPSFKALLEAPLYAEALEREAVPEALAKATSVLAGVKARGLAAGDVMDPQTEQMLWPQIVNEALARSVVALVRRQHRRQHRAHSLDPKNLALPPDNSSSSGSTSEGSMANAETEGADLAPAVAPPWEFEQLEEGTAAQLNSNSQGFACVDEFLGADWPELVLADVLRLTQSGGDGVNAASSGAGASATGATTATTGALSSDGSSTSTSTSSSSGSGSDSSSRGKRARGDLMTPVPVPERVAPGSWGDVLWLSDAMTSSLAADYPALAELVTALHALPYELNRQFAELPATLDTHAAKVPASDGGGGGATLSPASSPPKGFVAVPPLGSVRLTVAMPVSTALVRLRPGQRQPPRLDCVRGGPDDSGHRVAALYFLPPHTRSSSVAGAPSFTAPPLPPPPASSNSAEGAAGGERSPFGGDLVLFNVAAPGGPGESSERSTADGTENAAAAGAGAAAATATELATTPSTMDTNAGSVGGARVVAAQVDRLVLWRADGTRNERTPCVSRSSNNYDPAVTNADALKGEAGEDTCADLYAVAFWMHGLEL